jgi:hypothetical protein
VSKPKIAMFFGAGAEQCYGLPSGGKFALDLFRTPVEPDRQAFREQLQRIDNTSLYATKWLPDGYLTKRLHVFGKGEFEGLIASSLEYRRSNILDYLDNFDKNISKLLNQGPISEELVRCKFYESTGLEIGAFSYSQAVKLNAKLADRVNLFESEFFSAFLKLLEQNPGHKQLKRVIRALLELLVGAFGQQLVSRLNEELFEAAPESLSVFDDLSGIFSLNYRSAGQTGMEVVLEDDPVKPDPNASILELFVYLGRAILEDIYAGALDYQSLIDSHFRYLYSPRAEWAKFTRISIFLHTVRRYMTEIVSVDHRRLEDGPGYYHDLLPLSEYFDLIAIGTTNYNSFVSEVLVGTPLSGVPVFHLNGSVNEYYDPYTNSILRNPSRQELEELGRVVVPFIFTQSGIKPLTSISMSRRYVELYDKFTQADIICCIGYGFNGDDGHINGLLRALVEKENKKLFIMHHGPHDLTSAKRDYQARLRLSTSQNLNVLPIDDDRESDGAIWYENLFKVYNEQFGENLVHQGSLDVQSQAVNV